MLEELLLETFQNTAGSRDYIPLKLNASGVMPIIFAQAIMFLPMALARKFPLLSELQDPFGLWYNVIFALLIISSVSFIQRLQFQRIKWLMI